MTHVHYMSITHTAYIDPLTPCRSPIVPVLHKFFIRGNLEYTPTDVMSFFPTEFSTPWQLFFQMDDRPMSWHSLGQTSNGNQPPWGESSSCCCVLQFPANDFSQGLMCIQGTTTNCSYSLLKRPRHHNNHKHRQFSIRISTFYCNSSVHNMWWVGLLETSCIQTKGWERIKAGLAACRGACSPAGDIVLSTLMQMLWHFIYSWMCEPSVKRL